MRALVYVIHVSDNVIDVEIGSRWEGRGEGEGREQGVGSRLSEQFICMKNRTYELTFCILFFFFSLKT